MKEYLKPIITLVEFDEKDVLTSSASAFNIGWLGFDTDVIKINETNN